MAAVLEDDQTSVEGVGRGARRFERNRVLATGRDQSREVHRVELSGGGQVEIAEAVPDRLLDATDDAKRRQIARLLRIGEITGDTQLEGAMAVRLGVVVAKSGRRQLVAQSPDR